MAHHPRAKVVLPTHNGKHGHPVLCRWSLAPAMLTAPEGTGLNQVLRQQRDDTVQVNMTTSGILLDVDTPMDYAQALVQAQARSRATP